MILKREQQAVRMVNDMCMGRMLELKLHQEAATLYMRAELVRLPCFPDARRALPDFGDKAMLCPRSVLCQVCSFGDLF